jgi:hypothetical protein
VQKSEISTAIPASDGTKVDYCRARDWKTLHDKLAGIHVVDTADDRSDAEKPPRIARAFWADLSASETLSCLLLDAVASGYRDHFEEGQGLNGLLSRFVNDVKRINAAENCGKSHEAPAFDQTIAEVTALYNLLQLAHPRLKPARRKGKKQNPKEVLPDDAAAYVCWYSQLRELVERCPNLAEQLYVVALPGGGFTGDWYIGILNGSVSPALGRVILEKIICTREEEYKRFAFGLGLPNRKSLTGTGHMAWPRAWHIPMEEVLAIHHGALSRCEFSQYRKIRTRLSRLAWQLTAMAGPCLEKADETIRDIMKNRMFLELDRVLNPEEIAPSPREES